MPTTDGDQPRIALAKTFAIYLIVARQAFDDLADQALVPTCLP